MSDHLISALILLIVIWSGLAHIRLFKKDRGTLTLDRKGRWIVQHNSAVEQIELGSETRVMHKYVTVVPRQRNRISTRRWYVHRSSCSAAQYAALKRAVINTLTVAD